MEVDYHIREHGKRVYGLCRHLCGNAADADDLYQETWLRAVKGLAKFDASQTLNRASLNVTLAIYDTDSRELYYCEFDS